MAGKPAESGTPAVRPYSRAGLWVEWVLALVILAAFIRVGIKFYLNGYFPQPFFYEPSDTWMDWFNTAYWAHNTGAYDSWMTIYPPLSFILLKFMGLPHCYTAGTGLEMRDCDWLGVACLHVLYVIDIVLVARAFSKIDRRTALPRSFSLTVGMPMLYGLERGNLILFCFAFLVLGFGPLLRSARLRWFFIGMAVNLKVYVIAAVAALLLRRKWLAFEGCIIATVGVYLVTYGMMGAGTPIEIYRNITEFSSSFQSASVLDIWNPSTYMPLKSLLGGMGFPITVVIGSRPAELGLVAINVVEFSAKLILLAGAAATWLRPEKVPSYRAAMFALSFAMITSESGTYSQILVLFLLFMERWEGFARPAALVICYIVCVPAEIILQAIPTLIRYSYFTGGPVYVDFGIGLGMFVRPLLNMLGPVLIALHTIRIVWLDVREQGWSSRWRYRRDFALLPGVRRPSRPPASPTADNQG
ncbi:MAG: hypothetical protein ABGW87_09775 [Sphingomonadaceae bacterium]